ncbi:MAG: tetratricopeptide repeat protein [Cyanobacteria bacterium P01_D01_bin.6]
MTLTEAIFKQGRTLAQVGDFQAALENFNRLLELMPNNADGYGYRCVARHKLGDRAGAIADCQQAAQLYLAQDQLKKYQYALKMLSQLTREA